MLGLHMESEFALGADSKGQAQGLAGAAPTWLSVGAPETQHNSLLQNVRITQYSVIIAFEICFHSNTY